MATPPTTRRVSNETKRAATIGSVSGVTTRNGARKAKIQTRAMSASSKLSSALLAAKKKAQQKKRNSTEVLIRDHFQTAMDSKNIVRGDVGLVTDPRMLEHKCLWDQTYPECPERLSSIIERCKELGLLERCKPLTPRAASKAEILEMHSQSVYDMMLSTHQSEDYEFLEKTSAKYDSVYIHPTSHELALLSAGSTIDIIEAIVEGKIDCGAALIRPPGHHAMTAEPCGYCFYNNVGLAAKHALTKCGLKRILIVDWDVHHGQATQQMFYDDPRVVYFSIHRYEHGSFWPNLKQSNYNYVGCGSGTGYNFNVPLNKIKMQDSDYLAIWQQILLPMALEYQPEVVLVSAGYDAALGCPEGEMEVSSACYAHLTHLLLGVCSKIAVVLEGGYCLSSLAEGAALTLRALLGDPAPLLAPLAPPSQSIKETILNCIYAHKPYWNCFKYQPTYSTDTSVLNVSDINKEKHVVEVKWLGNEERAETFATRDCYPLQSKDFLDDVHCRLAKLKITTNLSVPPHRLCYVYDEAMLKHKNICEPGHVERPERLSSIQFCLSEWGLLDRALHIASRTATDEELLLVHSQSLLTLIQSTAASLPRNLIARQSTFESLYLHPDTSLSATTAVGSVLQVVDAVLGGEVRSGVCIVRPPGHHAAEDVPSGFCIYNNVAVAAKYAQSYHSLQRILIVDWDVHHGNGTQSIFIDNKHVLYISLHRYDHGTFFPTTTDGDYTRVGTGDAAGFNVNIPWNKRGMGDTEYLAAFTQVVLPIAYEFRPELVLVSAGFDACIGDPLGGCRVTPECFGRFTHWLSALANGKIILCLEGGYNVTAISYAMAMCTKALLGDPIVHNYESKVLPHPSAVESINNVISVQKQYWKNLCFQIALPKENVLPPPEKSRGLITSEPLLTQQDIFSNKIDNADGDTSGNLDNIDDHDLSIDGSKLHDGIRLNQSEPIISLTTMGMGSLSLGDSSVNTSDASLRCKENKVECTDTPEKSTSGQSESQNTAEDGPSCSSSSEPTAGSNSLAGKVPTLTDYLSDNLHALLNEEMFAVVPLNWCPHIETLTATPAEDKFVQGQKCANCEHTQENWVCLHCHIRACGRYIEGHMLEHYSVSDHALVLSLDDLSVWCNCCEAYLDNKLLYPYKNCAYRVKFGEDLPRPRDEPDTIEIVSPTKST